MCAFPDCGKPHQSNGRCAGHPDRVRQGHQPAPELPNGVVHVAGVHVPPARRGPCHGATFCAFLPAELYLIAYGRIHRNDGAVTLGATIKIVDGIRLAKIQAIIDALRDKRYR